MELLHSKSRFCSILCALFVSLCFISCENPLSSLTAKQPATFTGTIATGGAFPETLTRSLNRYTVSSENRSAIPSIDNTYYYFVHAEQTDGDGLFDLGKDDASSFELVDGKLIFGLPIGIGKWDITAGIKNADDAIVLTDIVRNVPITAQNSVVNRTFLLTPPSDPDDDLKGEVDLAIDFESQVTQVTVTWQGSDVLLPEQILTSSGEHVTAQNLDPGVYQISIEAFYDDGPEHTKKCFFTTVQTVNVLAGMTTNTWLSDGSDLFTAGTTGAQFYITSQVITNHFTTVLYVGRAAGVPSSVTVSDSNLGTAYSPLLTIQEALNRIGTYSSDGRTYRIFLTGTTDEALTVSNAMSDKAGKLIITGLGTGAVVDASSKNDTVLKIDTTTPVTLRNIQLTGGYAHYGAGIYMASGTTVTLEAGTLIGDATQQVASYDDGGYGNRASDFGGGIYNDGGTLTLKAGSKVCHNYAGGFSDYDNESGGGGIASSKGSVIIEDGAFVSYNRTVGRGGGIYLINGDNASTLTMNGGTISYNEVGYWGGGVLIGFSDDESKRGENSPLKFYMNGGEICYNKSTSTEYDWGVGAGGVAVDHSYMEMTGNAKIHHNEAAHTGGGLRVGGGGAFIMSGGEISDNTCYRESDASGPVSGGAIDIEQDTKVVLSGSARIPYGVDGVKGYRKNDVWFRYSYSGTSRICITIGGELTSEFEMGIKAPWARGVLIAQADGSNVTDISAYKDFITFTEEGWNAKPVPSGSQLKLDSPFFVKDGGSATATGTSADPVDSIEHACDLMDDPNCDYTICIDGEVTGTQNIPLNVTANSITLCGAHEVAADGTHLDVLNAGGTDDCGRVLHIENGNYVIITNLKITGGWADEAGGIWSASDLTLCDDTLIEGNRADDLGCVYVDSSREFSIKGNVVIYRNIDLEGGARSNLYLDADVAAQRINIIGPLVNSKDSSKKAQIGVTLAGGGPSLGDDGDILITNGYGYTNGYNQNVNPATYFIGDKWFVVCDNDEVLLAANGGTITVDPVYEDIKISVDKKKFLTSVAQKVLTFTATKTVDDEPVDVTSDTTFTYEIKYLGETVTSGTYYTPGTGNRANTLTLGNNLPLGTYAVSVKAVYNGKTYSAGFDVKITDKVVVTAGDAASAIAELTETERITVQGEMTSEQITAIANAIKEITTDGVNVKLDLSNVTGLTELPYGLFNLTEAPYQCEHLEEIILPEGITEIPTNTFINCSALKEVTLPETLTTIGLQAFWSCKSLTSITIPSSVTTIDQSAFAYCSGISHIEIPSSVTSIQGSAFAGVGTNVGGVEITLEAGNPAYKTVGDFIYTADESMIVMYTKKREANTTVTIPATVTEIGDYAFSNSGITTLIFEEGSQLTTIGEGAFKSCSGLTVLNMPDTVTSLGRFAFEDCPLTSIHLSTELTALEQGAFGHCRVEHFVVPDKVTEIGNSCFWYADFTTVTLPASLSIVENYAFGYCENLTTVNFKGTEAQKAAMTIGTGNEALNTATWNCNYTE